MWTYLVRHILRNRLGNLIVIGVITIFMAYMASNVKLSYKFAQMLPASDTTNILYEEFKEVFGKDGSVLFIGVKDQNIFTLDGFNAWYDLTYDIRDIDGVEEVVSIGKLYHLVRNDKEKKFEFELVSNKRPSTQLELDSILEKTFNLRIYDGFLFNRESSATLMAVTLDETQLDTKQRIPLINNIKETAEAFSENHNIKVHYSGLPYLRTVTSKKVADELKFFLLMAMLVASLALLFFFRSFKAMIFPMLIVVISVIWALGTISLFGYEITMLTGIIPPLLIVIGVENCIFLLNKYHHEYKTHGNKVKALSRVVQRVGAAIFLTNLTTGIGFAAFIVTGNKILVEFGVIASINILIVFVLSLFLIPIFFSYFEPPKARHIKHLERKFITKLVNGIVMVVNKRRKLVYTIAIIAAIIGFYGITKLKTTGNVVDDIPKKDPLYKDLMFFEKEFKGILPFEISIDSKKKKGILRLSTLKKIESLQEIIRGYDEFSEPLSIAEVVKFAKQSYYRGNPKFYSLPNQNELGFMAKYLPDISSGKRTILNSFIDSNYQKARISVQMANIGTSRIGEIKDELNPKIDSIFTPDKFDVVVTGTSVVFLKGTEYLVKNLATSLLLALLAITFLMFLLFGSLRMVVVSLIPNLLPQIMTAALMGYLDISIKPSTILIFSIALGISVDNAIHFLSRYRLGLKHRGWDIKTAVISALEETSYSMVYSSIVLFLGFAMFSLSTFGGIEAMGFLVSFTLLVAVMANLLVLPSLLLTLDERITTKAFKKSLLEIYDDDDIDVEELKIEEIDTRGSA